MLSVPGAKIPRKIHLKVAKADQLIESKKDGKKKNNCKFKISVEGGKKKEHSDIAIATNGAVQWNFECDIKLHRNQIDPLVLLVEDSDGHHKGQVVISVVKIPPKPHVYFEKQDPATSNNIVCESLEATKKCSEPAGFLYYWIWIEEYYEDASGDTGKKSFNKSMLSLFGSKNNLTSSKTNLKIKNPDSISNYSSMSNLNKPEKQKSSSFLNLKLSGKKKSKNNSSKPKNTSESSDVDSLSNYNDCQSNPFEIKVSKNDDGSSKHNSIGEFDNGSQGYPAITLKTYTNDPSNSQKEDVISYGRHDSYPDNMQNIKSNSNNTTNNILPTVAPSKANFAITDNNSSFKHINNPLSTVLPNKYKTMNSQELSSHKDHSIGRELPYYPAENEKSDSESGFRISHKSGAGSDYSIFSDRFQPPICSPNVNQGFNDELENIKRENAELKVQITKFNQQIITLQNDVDDVSRVLCKLRMKLLEDGVTKYLEI